MTIFICFHRENEGVGGIKARTQRNARIARTRRITGSVGARQSTMFRSRYLVEKGGKKSTCGPSESPEAWPAPDDTHTHTARHLPRAISIHGYSTAMSRAIWHVSRGPHCSGGDGLQGFCMMPDVVSNV